jgi:replicative DNA helicase
MHVPDIFSESAEQMTLASILLDNDQWYECSPLVTAESFYIERHRIIWRALEAVRSEGRPTDLEIVAQKLMDQGKLEQVGGIAYLVGLQNETMVSVYSGHYAAIVAEKAALRNLRAAGSKIIALTTQDLNVTDAFTQASTMLSEAAPKTGGHEHTQPVLADWQSVYQANVIKRTDPNARVITTGLTDFDRAVPSLDPGQLVMLAARPGMGKSGLALQAGTHNARRGLNVLIFSLEMTRDELTGRAACQEARVNYTRFQQGQLSQDELNRIEYAISRVTGRFHVNDQRGQTVDQIAAEAHRQYRANPIDFLIVDFLQRIEPRGKNVGPENRVQEVGYMARALKNLAGALSVPVLCLSSLSRAVESRQDKRPMLSDLRESGDIESEADLVIFPYRQSYYDSSADGSSELILAKRRGGETGTIDVTWVGEHVRFENAVTSRNNYVGGKN